MLGEWDSDVPVAARGMALREWRQRQIFQGRGSVCHLLLSVKMLSLFLFYRAENKPTCLRRLFLMRLKIFKNIFL